jgi:hypothetical protein
LKILAVLSAIIEISLGIDMKCSSFVPHTCKVENLVITSRDQTITSVHSETDAFFNVQDIKSLIFQSQVQKMNYVPKGLGKFFSQIEMLYIVRTELKEITKEDLVPFPLLKYLWIQINHLESLPSNLLEANPELSHINFNHNRLKIVGENILSPLKNLVYANFRHNTCINMVAEHKSEIPALIPELHNKCNAKYTKPESEEETEYMT